MPDSAVAIPIPPRFFWLKRLSIAAATLLVALIALRLTWGAIAHARLQREIDHHRATGQPVTLEEFNDQLAAIPSDDNAALLYEQAMDLPVITASDGSNFDAFLYDDDRLAPFVTRPAAAAELFTKNAPVRDLIRKARDRKQVAWSGGLNPNVFANHMMLRQLARSLAFAASYHFQTGNHEEAIETLIDFHRFNYAIAERPTIIDSLIAWACDAMAYDLITEHAAALSLTSDPAASSNHCPASRTQVNRLIELYLDETATRLLSVDARRGDAAMVTGRSQSVGYIAETIGTTGLPDMFRYIEHFVDYLLAPALARDTLENLQNEYRMADVLGEINWPRAARNLTDMNPEPNLLDTIAFPMTRSPCCAPAERNHTGARAFFKHLATRRMAAIALAIRLYELDHGHRPVELTDLVPDYLATLPSDPFTANAAPFRYACEFPYDEARAYLYSVGTNGLDNGGVLQVPLAKRIRSADDIHFFLDPEPLFIPPVPLPTNK